MGTLFIRVSHCQTQEDDYLLALSISSNAHYLVTGDFDLLELKKINNTTILKYSDFEAIMNTIAFDLGGGVVF